MFLFNILKTRKMIKIDIRKKLLSSTGEFTLNANIDIPSGEIVAFYGKSGTGKTTLLRIIAGLAAPDEGTINVEDNTWLDSRNGIYLPVEKRAVGYVFQSYALFPNMTIKENILFAQKKPDISQAKKLMEIFGLSSLQNRKPAMLSGGQQQRVALARAIACKPRIMLLDEPLSALDHEMRGSIQDEIKFINKEWGITTILVSHDVSEIFKLCTRVYSFNESTVVDKGNPANLFSGNRLSGKVQFTGEVLASENEDLIQILTLLVGNTPVKIVVPANGETFMAGDKVLIASKAFNPIIQKL